MIGLLQRMVLIGVVEIGLLLLAALMIGVLLQLRLQDGKTRVNDLNKGTMRRLKLKSTEMPGRTSERRLPVFPVFRFVPIRHNSCMRSVTHGSKADPLVC